MEDGNNFRTRSATTYDMYEKLSYYEARARRSQEQRNQDDWTRGGGNLQKTPLWHCHTVLIVGKVHVRVGGIKI